jgi:hypothetical protein
MSSGVHVRTVTPFSFLDVFLSLVFVVKNTGTPSMFTKIPCGVSAKSRAKECPIATKCLYEAKTRCFLYAEPTKNSLMQDRHNTTKTVPVRCVVSLPVGSRSGRPNTLFSTALPTDSVDNFLTGCMSTAGFE